MPSTEDQNTPDEPGNEPGSDPGTDAPSTSGEAPPADDPPATGDTPPASDSPADDPATPTASNDAQPEELVPGQVEPVETPASADQSSGGDTGSGDEPVSTASGTGEAVSQIIAVGTTAAKIMAASRPDYAMKSSPVAVLPKDADPLALSGFAPEPHEMRMVLQYSNLIGVTRVSLPIVVQWRYNGKLKGRGQYISNSSIYLDSDTDIGAFAIVDIDASLTGPWNAGTDADPIAAIEVFVNVVVECKGLPVFLKTVLTGVIQGNGFGRLKER